MMHDEPPKRVLFVCVENCNRSQMAEAFARMHGRPGQVEAYSAGCRPAACVHPKADFQFSLSVHGHSHGDPTKRASGESTRLNINQLILGVAELHRAAPVVGVARNFLGIPERARIDEQAVPREKLRLYTD
jgi:protein-tyrosine-phosphatase